MEKEILTREQIHKVYSSKGYDESYYHILEPTILELDITLEEVEPYFNEIMPFFLKAISDGYTAEWAEWYAFSKRCSLDQSKELEFESIREAYEKSSNPDGDWQLYLNSFNQGELFAKYMNYTLEHQCSSLDSPYISEENEILSDRAKRYVDHYNNLITKGHSEIYAEHYLEVFDYDEEFNIKAEVYGELYDLLYANQITNGQFQAIRGEIMDYEDNLYSLSEGNVQKYKEKLHDPKAISLIANIIGRYFLHLETLSKDFVPIYEKCFNEAMVHDEHSEMWMVRDDALDEYYKIHPQEKPKEWEYYRENEGLSYNEQMEILNLQTPRQRKYTWKEEMLDMMFPNGDDRDEQIGDFIDKL